MGGEHHLLGELYVMLVLYTTGATGQVVTHGLSNQRQLHKPLANSYSVSSAGDRRGKHRPQGNCVQRVHNLQRNGFLNNYGNKLANITSAAEKVVKVSKLAGSSAGLAFRRVQEEDVHLGVSQWKP